MYRIYNESLYRRHYRLFYFSCIDPICSILSVDSSFFKYNEVSSLWCKLTFLPYKIPLGSKLFYSELRLSSFLRSIIDSFVSKSSWIYVFWWQPPSYMSSSSSRAFTIFQVKIFRRFINLEKKNTLLAMRICKKKIIFILFNFYFVIIYSIFFFFLFTQLI